MTQESPVVEAARCYSSKISHARAHSPLKELPEEVAPDTAAQQRLARPTPGFLFVARYGEAFTEDNLQIYCVGDGSRTAAFQ
jgi:hypothetical protein